MSESTNQTKEPTKDEPPALDGVESVTVAGKSYRARLSHAAIIEIERTTNVGLGSLATLSIHMQTLTYTHVFEVLRAALKAGSDSPPSDALLGAQMAKGMTSVHLPYQRLLLFAATGPDTEAKDADAGGDAG